MVIVDVGLLVVGAGLLAAAIVWARRTRHARRVWRRTRHNTSTAAIVLELEERVHEIERLARPRVDAR